MGQKELVQSNDPWKKATLDDLRWIKSVATDPGDAGGFDVGAHPDRALVLHPFYKQRNGRALGHSKFGSRDTTARGMERLAWREYAESRDLPMPTLAGAETVHPIPFDEEDFVMSPDEGTIGDPETRQRIYDALVSFDANSGSTCTAYFADFYVESPRAGDGLSNILRGPLSAWRYLYDRPGYLLGPQNVWPDNHQWVLQTHADAWVTAISGPFCLINAIRSTAGLEVL